VLSDVNAMGEKGQPEIKRRRRDRPIVMNDNIWQFQPIVDPDFATISVV